MSSKLLALSLIVLGGCAHTTENETVSSSRDVIAVADPAPPEESDPAPARPRLSRTITLGRENQELTYTGETPRATRPQAGPNVVVNNNVLVQGPPGGFYGGYGYGRYGYGRGRGGDRGFARGASRGHSSGWGTNGFEGPGRTAAPGRTPGIGGNWPSAPSYGPASMR